MLNCKICHRKSIKNGFCRLHLKAYENIVDKYCVWRKALNVTWKEYLSEIEQNPLTGDCAKEIANYLIDNEGTISVEES